MGQTDILNFLKTKKKLVTAKEIANAIHSTNSSVNIQLNKLLKFNHIELITRIIKPMKHLPKRHINHYRYKKKMKKTTLFLLLGILLFLTGCVSSTPTSVYEQTKQKTIEVCEGTFMLPREYSWGMCEKGCVMINGTLVDYGTLKFIMDNCVERNKTILVKLA